MDISNGPLLCEHCDGESENSCRSVVAQEAVTQIVEVGTMVTHKGDESERNFWGKT